VTRLGFSRNLLRSETSGAHRVTFVELFFDLVFVFAVTQVSHVLLDHPGSAELVHTVMLTAAVWWVWIYTTWAVNWLDPEQSRVRGMLIGLMFLAMLMSSAIPEAFGDKALLFAGSMVAIQLGRSGFTLLAFIRHERPRAVNFSRITLWHVFAGVVWIAGALAPAEARPWVWLVALAIDFLGPAVRYWVPLLGGSDITTWSISGEHMAERVSLFFIIVLGESIIVTGTSFSERPLDPPHFLAFVSAFLGTVLMWLLYFSHSARGGSDYIDQAVDRGPIARTAYTYVPTVMVLGIVLAAVADGLVLKEPTVIGAGWTAALLCGSAAVFLLGNALFRRAITGPWPVGHFVGILALAALSAASPLLPALWLAWAVNAVLLVVVINDEAAWRRGHSGVTN
jgi:low temperature requirement protein LtrA